MAKQDFPKHVFKRGTGKVVNDSGLVVAESVLVHSEEHLAKLEGEWCESPTEAVAPAVKKEEKKEVLPVEAFEELEPPAKPNKKVK